MLSKTIIYCTSCGNYYMLLIFLRLKNLETYRDYVHSISFNNGNNAFCRCFVASCMSDSNFLLLLGVSLSFLSYFGS